METKTHILNRLAECRAAYQGKNTQEQLNLLLENTMVALQDLLYLEKISWEELVKEE